MPRWVAAILDAPATSMVGRVLLTFTYWFSGLTKLLDWRGGLSEMAHFNLHPEPAYAAATIVATLAGSALVVWGPYAWLGAGVLAVFTAVTIPIAHPFWTLSGASASSELKHAIEHVACIGGLVLAAILRHRETTGRRWEASRQ
jgi:transmembrane protein